MFVGCTEIINDHSAPRENRAIAYLNRGESYQQKGDDGRALKDLTEALKLNPGLTEAYQIRGIIYLAKDDYDRFAADINEAIKLDPLFVGNYNLLGITYIRIGKKAEAIAEYRKILSIDPTNKDAKEKLKSLGTSE